jgi:hypothetical protein
MTETDKPCEGMTFEEFCFLLPQFEWVVIYGYLREKGTNACPIAAVAGRDGGSNHLVYSMSRDLGLDGALALRIIYAADGSSACDGEDLDMLREYCLR